MDRYGVFVAIVAAAAILQAVAELGLHTLLTRTVARAPDAAWHELRGALIRQAALFFQRRSSSTGTCRSRTSPPMRIWPGS